MPEEKKCIMCGKPFAPSNYRPEQTVCSSPDCQHKRQLSNMKEWRAKKAASPEGSAWKEASRLKSAEWREKHQTYLKLYREEHKEKRGKYMKEYMRDYRKRDKPGEKKTDPSKESSRP